MLKSTMDKVQTELDHSENGTHSLWFTKLTNAFQNIKVYTCTIRCSYEVIIENIVQTVEYIYYIFSTLYSSEQTKNIYLCA